MRRYVIASIATCLFAASGVRAASPAGGNRITAFLIDSASRDSQTLSRDGALVLKAMANAKAGERVEVFAVQSEGRPRSLASFVGTGNAMKDRRQQQHASKLLAAQLSRRSSGNLPNLPAALRAVLEHIAITTPSSDAAIVIMDDGLIVGSTFTWVGSVPSDSWATHRESPIASFRAFSGSKRPLVIMLPERTHFADPTYEDQIVRFWRIFWNLKKCDLTWAPDHKSAEHVLVTGDRDKTPPDRPQNLSGPLVLTRWDP